MLRILGLILAFYLVGLTVIDTTVFGGRYSAIAWQEANYRAYRVGMEIQHLLDKADNWAHATGFAAPSRADGRR